MIKGRTVRINKPTSNKTKGKIEEENEKKKKKRKRENNQGKEGIKKNRRGRVRTTEKP